MAVSEPALAFTQVSYAYPGASLESLSDVELRIDDGEWVGVVGPTNAGKSTLCLSAMGLVPHFYGGRLKGTVTVYGRDSRTVSVAQRSTDVGLLFQNPFTQISGARDRVDDEIGFGPECHGLPRVEINERVEEAMGMVGLTGLAARHPADLSGGQLQRLALAALLAMRPRMLILDEPTSQLDPAGTASVFEILEGLHARGTTIVMVEHRLEKLCELCPRIVALVGGRLLADGAPGEVFNQPQVQERIGMPVYTRLASSAGLPQPWPVLLADATSAFERRRA
jgi:energy-coupling factor transport system ATP-binding protein